MKKAMLTCKVDAPEEEEEDKLDEETPRRFQSVVSVDHLEEKQRVELMDVLHSYPEILRTQPGRTNLVEHSIYLTDPTPIRQRPYRVPESLITPLRAEIKMMMDMGVIESSTSAWSSPIVLVPKKDGTLRLCLDFRKLNAVSKFDAYPMPCIDELIERIGRAKYITMLDHCKGYWQVPLEKTSREYTAFRTPVGLYQFTTMPFGLHGAPATFQRLMDLILQDCEDCSAAYLDDVVIYSNTWKDHLQHLHKILHKIQKAALTLNVTKCELAKHDTKYLGFQLGNGEVRPQLDKVEAIRNCPRPRTKKEVRSFLGLVGWYRRFIPQFSEKAVPLTNLKTKMVKNPVPWTEDCEHAFTYLKECLCTFPVLRSPDFAKRFLVQVDASARGIGAVLLQEDRGQKYPVLYLSRKLLPRETRYATIEKEGLAIKWALESLRYYLLGREFDLETDHRALSWIHSMKDRNARVTRWYLSLQPYKFQIRYKAGKENIIADYLSRLSHTFNPGEG